MKIYFTCSTAEFNKYKDYYFAIRKFLISQNHILTRDWLTCTEELLNHKQIDISRDIRQIYKKCIKAIQDADLVIIEDTVSNFSTGHQITVALQRRKPTLVLWQGKKHRQFNQMFIHGVESDFLEIAEYDTKNLKKIIKRFIKKYENPHEKNRFNLVLNNVERRYLDWAQFNKNKSRTRIIRDALRNAILNDKQYSKFLEIEPDNFPS